MMWQKIIFVCTGNTCRSPMAEGLMKKELGNNSNSIQISSRGLDVLYPQKANEKAHSQMAQRDIDLTNHRSTLLEIKDIDKDTLLLTMTSYHKSHLSNLYPSHQENIFTLKEYVNEEGDVADPFGGNNKVYENCANELDYLIKKLVELFD